MSITKNISALCLFTLLFLFATASILHAEGEPIKIYTNDDMASNGGVAFNCYPSGYSDGWYWGVSERHLNYNPYPWEPQYHEMLSGEYGAAIYYNGITNNQSMWLSNYWLYPFWTTNSNFDWVYNNSWDNPSNPLEPFYPS